MNTMRKDLCCYKTVKKSYRELKMVLRKMESESLSQDCYTISLDSSSSTDRVDDQYCFQIVQGLVLCGTIKSKH